MEEITLQLDDETASWLESVAADQKMSISEIVAELIREMGMTVRPTERDPG